MPDSSASAAGLRWLARVVHQALADQLLDRGGAPAAAALAPPGAEQLADHEFRVERAAHGQQLARRAQQFGEERVRRRQRRLAAGRSLIRRRGWLRRLCGLTLIASQIWTCGRYATLSCPL